MLKSILTGYFTVIQWHCFNIKSEGHENTGHQYDLQYTEMMYTVIQDIDRNYNILKWCREWYMASIGFTIYWNDVDSDRGHQYDLHYTFMV